MHATLEIRQMALAQLTPAPYNPRRPFKPGDAAYEKLAASLRDFGLVEPLVWNESTGHVVGGHLRLAILRELGTTEAPVSVVRLSPAREKALNIVLNNREAQGRFDPKKLAEILTELRELPELELTGFDARDLSALQMTPLDEMAPLPERAEVEITLTAPRDRLEAVVARLDPLISEFDLRCHIQR